MDNIINLTASEWPTDTGKRGALLQVPKLYNNVPSLYNIIVSYIENRLEQDDLSTRDKAAEFILVPQNVPCLEALLYNYIKSTPHNIIKV